MAILPSTAMKMNLSGWGVKRGKGEDERTVVRLQDVLEFACARHNGQEEG